MIASPRYYFDMRDMMGNDYAQSGVGLKLVAYSKDSSGNYTKNSPIGSGIVLAEEPNFGFFVVDIAISNMYDLYMHKPDVGYVMLQEAIWLTGSDIDSRLLEKRSFRVSSGTPVLFAQDYEQVAAFNIRNWDDTVYVTPGDNKFRVVRSEYSPDQGAMVVVVRPTMYATPRERARFVFVKTSTREAKEAYAYVL